MTTSAARVVSSAANRAARGATASRSAASCSTRTATSSIRTTVPSSCSVSATIASIRVAERVHRGGHLVLPAGGRLDPGSERLDRGGAVARGRPIRQAGLDPLEPLVDLGAADRARLEAATVARRSARSAAWRSSSAAASWALLAASASTLRLDLPERLAELVERRVVGEVLEPGSDLVDPATEPVVGDGRSARP